MAAALDASSPHLGRSTVHYATLMPSRCLCDTHSSKEGSYGRTPMQDNNCKATTQQTARLHCPA